MEHYTETMKRIVDTAVAERVAEGMDTYKKKLVSRFKEQMQNNQQKQIPIEDVIAILEGDFK